MIETQPTVGWVCLPTIENLRILEPKNTHCLFGIKRKSFVTSNVMYMIINRYDH